MNSRKLLAEAIGTFSLTLVVLLSSFVGQGSLTFLLAGLTLALFVYTIGSISGCHINPAVTIGVLSLKKIEPRQALFYIIAQIVGALLALLLVMGLKIQVPMSPIPSTLPVLAGETIGAAIFTFGIAAAVLGRVSQNAAGIVIGASLTLGVLISLFIGGPGILNPAVAIGLKSISVFTLSAPIIGSLIGMQLYKFLVTEKVSLKKK